MVSQALLSPVESPRRVFLFEDAGLMTEQAANTLLKTWRTTAPVIFLLAAESRTTFLRPSLAAVEQCTLGSPRRRC